MQHLHFIADLASTNSYTLLDQNLQPQTESEDEVSDLN
jgi:hypothetical protein